MVDVQALIEASSITLPLNDVLAALKEASRNTTAGLDDETVASLSLAVQDRLSALGIPSETIANIMQATFGDP